MIKKLINKIKSILKKNIISYDDSDLRNELNEAKNIIYNQENTIVELKEQIEKCNNSIIEVNNKYELIKKRRKNNCSATTISQEIKQYKSTRVILEDLSNDLDRYELQINSGNLILKKLGDNNE